MRTSFNQLLLILATSLFIYGCQKEPVDVELIRINDQGIAMFEVYNRTDQNFSEMDFEVTYLDGQNEVILIDTLHYEMAEESAIQIFLEANGETMFSQTVPENTVSASARIINRVNE
ncbi:MAG: hypothetical protein R3283_11320 [Balneolaceae bacterium]|nr:hypothetical protein [Balneolaceae bacterium]